MSAEGWTAGCEHPGREVIFADLFNVRDLGGHRTADGRRVRHGRWFRGAGLHRVSGADVAVLQGLGVRTALDLRTTHEIDGHGAFPTLETGIAVRHLPLIPRPWAAVEAFDDEDVAVRYLIARFAEMLESGGQSIADAIDVLATPEAGPVIVYCMAGKDRTGVLTATVLGLLGVPDDAIARDFQRSQAAMEQMVARMAESGSTSTMVQQSPHLRAAPPEAILGFLAEARRRYGTLAEYVAGHGAGPQVVERLRTALLEDPPPGGEPAA